MHPIVLFVWIAAALGFLAYAVYELLLAIQSRKWPVTEGTVIESRVEIDRGTEGGPSMTAHVSYAYYVDGQRHVSKRVHFGGSNGVLMITSRRAPKVVARYPFDARVSVRYSPSRPDLGVLEPGVHAANFGLILVALVLLAIPIVVEISG